MKLSLKTSYLSIARFPDIELPPFTLITGVNGSGKTHLLQAIQGENIAVDCAPNPELEIRLFDWTNMVPKDDGRVDSRLVFQDRTSAIAEFRQHAPKLLERVASVGRRLGLPQSYLSNPQSIITLSDADLLGLGVSEDKVASALQDISAGARYVSDHLKDRIPGAAGRLDQMAQRLRKPVAAFTEDDLQDILPSWGDAALFQQAFARLFVCYRDLKVENSLKRLAHEEDKQSPAPLTDDQFIEKFGQPPWLFVNRALVEANLDFEIDHPNLHSLDPYQPRLRKISTGGAVYFANLSSGEKIIMSFAFCLYYSQDGRQSMQYPKLLLLDEIDAPLHPSMTRGLLKTITETIVKKNQVKVVLTTHSPTTVALGPEEALYVLDSVNGLAKTTKAQALNALTVGVPTLAIQYEGRRQVFVESPNDAALYDLAHALLKDRLGSERSLQFVATGVKTSTGQHLNTGCDQVKRLVNELEDAGNESVYGLIDWDGRNDPTGRIFVIGHNRRNGLENVLLDPLLLAAFISRHCLKRHGADIGLPASASYFSFCSSSTAELQRVVDAVQSKVLRDAAPVSERSDYLGGLSLDLKRAYLRMDDHDLEAAVLAAFPALNAFNRPSLKYAIVDTVIRDSPDFTPRSLVDSLQSLLNSESHS